MHLLKEWSYICETLAEGRQILLARKGGILDESRFSLPHPDFLLWPTHLHQREQLREALKPDESPRINAFPVHVQETSSISVGVFCRVTDCLTITNPDTLRKIDGDHVWKQSFLEQRLRWGHEELLTIMLVRAYRLRKEISIPSLPSYSGCRSWIEIDEIPLPSMDPVLSEEAFFERRRRILQSME